MPLAVEVAAGRTRRAASSVQAYESHFAQYHDDARSPGLGAQAHSAVLITATDCVLVVVHNWAAAQGLRLTEAADGPGGPPGL